MFNLILFGPPGSGKGTQAEKIAEKYNFAHISTGEIFRYEMKNETALGLKVKDIIERGELVPDEVLIEILESALNKQKDVKGIIYDGFPRTIRQAEDLDKLMSKKQDCVNLVLALDVDDDEVVGRLLKRAEIQGRKDDTKEVIENRLEVYKAQTYPLMDFYKEQKKFTSVEGVGTIEEIFERICSTIGSYYCPNCSC